MKKIASFIKAALCSAAGILIMAGCTNYSEMLEEEPQEYVSLAAENTAEAMTEAMIADNNLSEEYMLLDEALKNGSFHIEFEAEGIKFSGDCYMNEKDETSSQTFTLTGNKGTSAQIYAFVNKNIMKLGTIGNSGTHVYSFDMNTLADKIKTSIFAPDSDSNYAVSEEDFEMFLEYAAEINSAIKGEAKNDDTYSPYKEIIDSYLEAHPPVTSEKTEATINGETVLANVVKYDLSKKDLRTLAEQLINKVMEDEAILEGSGYSKEEIEELKSEILSELDELEDYSIQLVYYVNSDTNELMEIDAEIKWAEPQNPENDSDPDDEYSYLMGAYLNRNGAYDVSVSAIFGADPANSEKQKLQVDYSVDYYDNTYLEDSSGKFLAETSKSENKSETVITMTEDGKTTELATLISEKNGDNYTVTLEIPELEATLGMTGTMVKDKDSLTITIDRLFMNSGSSELAYLPKAVISVKKGGTLLDLDAEKEFFDLTEEEMDALMENIEADFEAVFSEYAEDSSLGNYMKKSKLSLANANSKSAYTAIATQMVKMEIDGETIKSDTVTGVGSIVTIDGKEFDLTDYLGEISGYIYAEIDPNAYAINFALWSEEPIPDKYKRILSNDEKTALMDDGIIIGCYPLNLYT